MDPIAAKIIPNGNCVKNFKDKSVERTKTSLTNMLVDEPIRVVIPAKIQTKLSGIM